MTDDEIDAAWMAEEPTQTTSRSALAWQLTEQAVELENKARTLRILARELLRANASESGTYKITKGATNDTITELECTAKAR